MRPGTDARVEQDADSRLEQRLADLESGKLGQRIALAARLALARHLQTVQTIRSAGEAEDSAP